MKALVWPVATYGCESWTLRKNEETRLDASEMKGLRKIRRVSWAAKKTNEWVVNTVKARKLAYCGHINLMQGTMPGACKRGRPRTAWMDNIKTWTGLPVKESIRNDGDKWRKYVHDVANPRIEDG